MADNSFWRNTVIYQIYPRSFQDSNGDGIGDLPGIISRLDYLKSLGIETLWFSPFYAGPQKDFGYDISDYRSIAPEYGTMKDAEELISEIHKRGMKILFDMVLNHTSEEHSWFKESRSSRDNPKRDWYVWKEGKGRGGRKPPNNWKSMPGGSGWHYDKTTGQWYWAQFLACQPDLNWRNPAVKKEMFDTVRFWLKKGVDGFRLDIIGAVLEDPDFRNNPLSFRFFPSEDSGDRLFRSAGMTQNYPDNFPLVKELRSVMDEFPDKFLLGEVFGSPEDLRNYCGREKPDGLHSVFNFRTLSTPFRAKSFAVLLKLQESLFPGPDYSPVYAFSNHDRARAVSRLGNNDEKAKLLMAFQIFARGIPVFYYGEEIGIPQAAFDPKKSLDPVAAPFKKLPRPLFRLIDNMTRGAVNRDNCRTPMRWNCSPNKGFCPEGISPWLPAGPEKRGCSVEEQADDSGSMLNHLKKCLEIRNRSRALSEGTLSEISVTAGTVLSFIRTFREEKLAVCLNFSGKPKKTGISGKDEIIPPFGFKVFS